MIEEILPDGVVAVEARRDPADVTLFPEEEAVLTRAVDKRRREFTTARACAREAFAKLDLSAAPIPVGRRGEPEWPPGVIGSITHCEGYRACVVARAQEVTTIGIDAEPHRVLPDGVLGEIARPEELPWLRDMSNTTPEVHWDRLLFCAKEATYKAWFPLARHWLGFQDATVAIDYASRAFSVAFLVPGPQLADGELTGFSGRWLIREGLVLTAIALPSVKAGVKAG